MNTASLSAEQAVLAYAAIWSESDPIRQGELIAQSLTENARILGPGYQFTGHAAILAEVQRFNRNQPGVRAVFASGIDAHHNTARFAVAIVMPDGSIPHEGEDVVLFAPDGRIELVLTYWGALPPMPESWPHRVTTRPSGGA
jgi:hypothetical protein